MSEELRQLRTELYDLFHVFYVVVYWPPRAMLRQFKRRS